MSCVVDADSVRVAVRDGLGLPRDSDELSVRVSVLVGSNVTVSLNVIVCVEANESDARDDVALSDHVIDAKFVNVNDRVSPAHDMLCDPDLDSSPTDVDGDAAFVSVLYLERVSCVDGVAVRGVRDSVTDQLNEIE